MSNKTKLPEIPVGANLDYQNDKSWQQDGDVWYEQEVIDAWLKKHDLDLTHEATYQLKKDASAERIKADKLAYDNAMKYMDQLTENRKLKKQLEETERLADRHIHDPRELRKIDHKKIKELEAEKKEAITAAGGHCPKCNKLLDSGFYGMSLWCPHCDWNRQEWYPPTLEKK